ncbi:glycosyltransferase, partial [Candidatus Saccharibacteria bacterium]|nr:glycosyltransferase [Candidatus Saccharibacteria bacterium]
TPIQWEEPFGLTTVEAMACGTPVISLHRGAAPEIIEDGKTGFIVHSINEMVEAVGKIDQINRQDCRDRVVEEFSNDCMVDRYEKIFCELVHVKADADIKATEIIRPGEIIKTKLEEVKQTLKKIIK